MKKSSRSQIRIKEVKNGVLVLPDGKYRMILETSSVNFELKSEEEQDALIENFQRFLNSLPTPLQVVVRVREINVDGYIENFLANNSSEKRDAKTLKNYAKFIKNLVSGNKIMTRRFFIIVPISSRTRDFQISYEELRLNVDIVSKGLEKLGMKTRILENIEVLDLFYGVYNWTHLKSQPFNEHFFKSHLGGYDAV